MTSKDRILFSGNNLKRMRTETFAALSKKSADNIIIGLK